ncbi:VTT domain-containing protein [Croceibacterium sp. TMG7-5b_MA50]|uniref:VTT domain-containing protein n=1 Tax=Croceibacterium sp. TMG7-5b_MA50 TaxID=3121290 RepID=UPI00322213C8
MIAADPIAAALLLVAPLGLLGVFTLSLVERVVPVLPSQGLFAAIGMASAQGHWNLPAALSLSVLGSSVGAGACFVAGCAMARSRRLRLPRGLRRRFGLGRRLPHGNGATLPFSAQMVPAVRLLAPLMGGAMRADPRRFLLWTLAGLSLWNAAFMTLGYLLAQPGRAPNMTLVCLMLGAASGLLLLLLRITARWRRLTASRWSDRLRFWRAWLRDPLAVAALAPSGRALAALITREIAPGTGPVLELGSGTGVFAQALLARGVPASSLTLVERDPDLAALLRRRFPDARILSIDAAALAQNGMTGPMPFGSAVCGLGLLAMPPAQVESILRATFARLAPGASLYLFTYGRQCSVPDTVLQRLSLTSRRIGTAWRNLPPATVHRLRATSPLEA